MSDTMTSASDYPDQLIRGFASMVHLDEWRKVLGVNPYYRTASFTLTVDANRQIPLASLSTGAGNSKQTFHRVLEVVTDGGENLTYTQPDRLRLVNQAAVQTTTRLWTRVGTAIQCYGVTAGDTVHVLVNWLPTAAGDLASVADTVDWIDGWEPILWYEIAAHLLAKAGRETTEARELMGMAEVQRQKLLQDVGRDASQPYVLGANDEPWEWGG